MQERRQTRFFLLTTKSLVLARLVLRKKLNGIVEKRAYVIKWVIMHGGVRCDLLLEYAAVVFVFYNGDALLLRGRALRAVAALERCWCRTEC